MLPGTGSLGAGERGLGDFTTPRSVLGLAAAAVLVGAAVALLALALLDLIGLITHLAYTGTLSTSLVTPDTSVLGVWSVSVPVVGGLVVGVMARVGSERIRGHGIPEAMETILLRGSRMEPRLAVLKPISSAVSIGTGGPFGAEGPIIVTGGALGSIVGQLLHLTAAQRRTLLVAGAAGGMTAVFATPVAAVLLAVELLLFEWRPRSMVPVALAACSAEAVREALASAGLLRAAPLFAINAHGSLGMSVTLGAMLVGVACGGLAWVMTRCVYGAEDLFGRLPLHWSWWPAIGGVFVGVGGLIDPRVLGVGYATIGAELAGELRARSARHAARRQARGLGDRAGIEYQRRDPRPLADARRRSGRVARRGAPGGRRGHVGADRDGRRDGRRDALAVHEHRVRARGSPTTSTPCWRCWSRARSRTW